MGLGQKILTRVGSIFVAQVGLAVYGLGLKINSPTIFFSSGQKKSLCVWSKSTRVEGGSVSYLLGGQK